MRLIALLFTLALTLCGTVPQRIVSTAPSITETLFAMGLGPRVVGVTIYCQFPPEVLKLPKVGTFLKPDVEAIVALHPDLVVVQRQPNRIPEQLDRLHIPHVDVDSKDLDAVYAGARAIGHAADASAAAEHFIQSMQSQLNEIRHLTAGRPRPSVAFIVGHTPGQLGELIAGGANSMFSDLLGIAGGANVFSDTPTPYPRISLEEVIARNPEFILELSGDSRPKQEEVVSLWRIYPSLRAVVNSHVYAVGSGPFVVPGPRSVDAARIVLRLLHPEIHL
jgi:iron complex transport system substrate-binding protein